MKNNFWEALILLSHFHTPEPNIKFWFTKSRILLLGFPDRKRRGCTNNQQSANDTQRASLWYCACEHPFRVCAVGKGLQIILIKWKHLKFLLLTCENNLWFKNNYPCILCFLELLHSLQSCLVIHLLKYFYLAQDRLGCALLLHTVLSCLLILWRRDRSGGLQYRLAKGRFCCNRRRMTLGRCPGNFVAGNSWGRVWLVLIGSGVVKGLFSVLGSGLQRAVT